MKAIKKFSGKNVLVLLAGLWLIPSLAFVLVWMLFALFREPVPQAFSCRIHIKSLVDGPTTWFIGRTGSSSGPQMIKVPARTGALHVLEIDPALHSPEFQVRVNRVTANGVCRPNGRFLARVEDAGLALVEETRPSVEP